MNKSQHRFRKFLNCRTCSWLVAFFATGVLVTMLPAAEQIPARLYHGVAYYPELWPEADVDRDIAEMKKLGINVARLGEFAWATMEPSDGKISLEFFRRVLDKLHAADIRVILCTPTATPPIWLTHDHPERAFVDANGVVMIHGARQHVSYEHPTVRKASFRIVEAMARELGKHPALIGWQIDNEFKCHVAEDYSDAAVASWHRWLKNRYGTIDRLNAAWGTDIWSQRYQKFEQVPAPKKTPFLHNASLSTAYRIFNREAIAEFMDAQSALIRRHSAAPITHNMAAGFSISIERMSRNLDFVSFDDYPSANEWPDLAFDYDLFRGAKPGHRFWFMETSSSHNGWLGNNTEIAHPPGFLVAEAVSAYAFGAEGFSYWLWRQQRAGAELPHSAVMSAWFKPGIGYESVRAVEAARRQLEPLLVASKPVMTEVAITWSDRGRAILQTEAIGAGRGTSVDHKAIVSQWQRLFLNAGINREFRTENASLDGLKLLVTPAMPAVDEAFVARLRPWVEAGGIWICVSPSGTRTAEHTVPTNAGLGLVDALAGVETVVGFPANGTDAKGEAFGQSAALQGWCSALKPVAPETKIIGPLKTKLLESELAFITERKLGQGAVVLIGAHLGGDVGWNLRAKLVEHYAAQAGVTQRYAVSGGTVVAPRVRADGSALWIAVNLDGKGGHVELPTGAKDALTGLALAAELKLERYGWKAIAF